MEARLLTSQEYRRWDDLAAKATGSGFMQSTAWAALQQQLGLTTFLCGLFEGQELIGGALCIAPPTARQPGYLVIRQGPVLPWHDLPRARVGLRLLTALLRELTAERMVIGLRVEPGLPPPPSRALATYRRAPADALPVETLCLDLSCSAADLLAAMAAKARYNIRLAARHGVTTSVYSGPDHDYARLSSRLYACMEMAGRRDAFWVESPRFFKALSEVLVPRGLAHLIFAEHEGDDLAAMFLITFGGRATYLYGGTSDLKRSLMGGYALQWAAIQTARAAGCSTYDFYGFEPTGLRSHPYARLSRFKRQFGGRVERFCGAYDRLFPEIIAPLLAADLAAFDKMEEERA